MDHEKFQNQIELNSIHDQMEMNNFESIDKRYRLYVNKGPKQMKVLNRLKLKTFNTENKS